MMRFLHRHLRWKPEPFAVTTLVLAVGLWALSAVQAALLPLSGTHGLAPMGAVIVDAVGIALISWGTRRSFPRTAAFTIRILAIGGPLAATVAVSLGAPHLAFFDMVRAQVLMTIVLIGSRAVPLIRTIGAGALACGAATWGYANNHGVTWSGAAAFAMTSSVLLVAGLLSDALIRRGIRELLENDRGHTINTATGRVTALIRHEASESAPVRQEADALFREATDLAEHPVPESVAVRARDIAQRLRSQLTGRLEDDWFFMALDLASRRNDVTVHDPEGCLPLVPEGFRLPLLVTTLRLLQGPAMPEAPASGDGGESRQRVLVSVHDGGAGPACIIWSAGAQPVRHARTIVRDTLAVVDPFADAHRAAGETVIRAVVPLDRHGFPDGPLP
ncbi:MULTISPECIES: hypothetical protein [Arthrobacter]|uniref:Histidine kinase n=2 Tax=Arthrobacter TaxID=1663 RepID=A0ABU9KMY7_9MICC|nr:hypothetical protein [Arthrobacter sp. YJM1]MDP5227703.1 hypothetical protein [Arthrobacter sp. YJM1]